MGDNWRKSSYSGANGGSCVETASDVGMILVRDTTDRDGFTLNVPRRRVGEVHRLAQVAAPGNEPDASPDDASDLLSPERESLDG